MNGILQLPQGFIPPRKVMHEQYFLAVLAPQHNEIDYDAWTSSRETLQGIFGPTDDWPPYEYSKAQNLADLERHEREFTQRIAYAYTILSPDTITCIGCLYIRPTTAVQYDARVDFWFRDSHKNIESCFFDALQRWLHDDWQFATVAFPGRNITWDAYNTCVSGKK